MEMDNTSNGPRLSIRERRASILERRVSNGSQVNIYHSSTQTSRTSSPIKNSLVKNSPIKCSAIKNSSPTRRSNSVLHDLSPKSIPKKLDISPIRKPLQAANQRKLDKICNTQLVPDPRNGRVQGDENHNKLPMKMVVPENVLKEKDPIVVHTSYHIPRFSLPIGGAPLTNQDFEVNNLLGKGGYSKVFAVKLLATGERFALKHVTLENENRTMLEEEVRMLEKCRDCNHVIDLISHSVTSTHMTLLLQCASGDLANMLSAQKSQKVDIRFLKYWSGQMFEAVNEVHNLNIVHADLKPANFLVVDGILKVCDFGIANSFGGNTTSVHRECAIGTLSYMAPETIKTSDGVFRVTRASDIWSCGIILYQMMFKDFPELWDEGAELDIPRSNIDGTPVPAFLYEVIENCLQMKPNRRWSASVILNHSFYCSLGIDLERFTAFANKVYDYGVGHGKRNHRNSESMLKRCKESYAAFERLHYSNR